MIGVNAADVIVRQCILHNMMGCVVIGSIGQHMAPEELAHGLAGFTPTFTQNHIYNTGRFALCVRYGSPLITHNVVRARADMDTTGWEQGAGGADATACPVYHHNYLDGSPPRPYQGEIFGRYHEYTEPAAFSNQAYCPLRFEYNTVVGSPNAVWGPSSQWSMQHNNVIVVPALGPAAELGNRESLALTIRGFGVPDGDDWIAAFLEHMGAAPKAEVIVATNNYWGTADAKEIEARLRVEVGDVRIEYRPFASEFMAEALPDWREFEW